jgi:glycosyltransferase involved in cell wall biosynthesis
VASSLDWHLQGQLSFLNQYYETIAISGSDFHLDQVKNRENVRVIPVYFCRRISVLQDLVSFWKLFQILRIEKPLIVHSITPKAGLITMMASYLAGVPIRLHTFTGLIFPHRTGVLKQILILMDKILCRLATHVYPEGRGVKSDLEKYKITKKNLKILGNGNVNGINLEYFNHRLFSVDENNDFRLKLGLKANNVVFVFVGRLVKDKGIEELIDAFVDLSAKSYAKLLLVGPFEHELDKLADKTLEIIHSHKSIISVGLQIDVRPYISLSDILVFPSYREGFPNVPLQCGAMKKALILSNVTGCNEIVSHNKNGLLVPARNKEELRVAMLELLDNVELRNRFSEEILKSIQDRYEQSIVWNALKSEYDSLINQLP